MPVPRDALGVVTLPVGNPVVNGTAISADVHNQTVADLASMIEDSLSRSGKGGMDSPMQFADGTAANPAITFSSETTTGFFRSAGLLGLAVVGAVRASLTNVLARFYTPVQMDSTLTVTGRITASAGVAGILTGDLPARSADKISAVISTGAVSPLAFADIADASVTNFISGGNRIFITLTPDGSATPSIFMVNTATAINGCYAYVECFRSATGAGTWTRVGIVKLQIAQDAGALGYRMVIPASSIVFTDVPGVATGWDYKLQWVVTHAELALTLTATQMLVYER